VWVPSQDTFFGGRGDFLRWHFDLPQFTHTRAEEHRPGHRWSQTDFHSQLSPEHHSSWVVSSAVLQPLKTLPVLWRASRFLIPDKYARLAYWNMLVPRRFSNQITQLTYIEDLSKKLFAEDKAFFYSDFIVEEVRNVGE